MGRIRHECYKKNQLSIVNRTDLSSYGDYMTIDKVKSECKNCQLSCMCCTMITKLNNGNYKGAEELFEQTMNSMKVC